jgi:hypothetical protein
MSPPSPGSKGKTSSASVGTRKKQRNEPEGNSKKEAALLAAYFMLEMETPYSSETALYPRR